MPNHPLSFSLSQPGTLVVSGFFSPCSLRVFAGIFLF